MKIWPASAATICKGVVTASFQRFRVVEPPCATMLGWVGPTGTRLAAKWCAGVWVLADFQRLAYG
nr:MAG TPA: hypothetical protein [Caudoviricetes sp.]